MTLILNVLSYIYNYISVSFTYYLIDNYIVYSCIATHKFNITQ